MAVRNDLIPKYLSEDGRYLGFLCDEEIIDKKVRKFRFNDNDLEHIVQGTIVSSAKTKEMQYSHLVELNPPAPQRLRDQYYFVQIHHLAVGEVSKEQLKLYANTVFKLGAPLAFVFTSESNNVKVSLRGKIISEEESTRAPQFKYSFLLKLDKEFSDEEYASLKTVDVDKV